MNMKINTPTWLLSGPKDVEYCMYKMKGAVLEIKRKLLTNNFIEALYEIDDTLDYLYMYDATKMTQGLNADAQIINSMDLPELEMFFEPEDTQSDPVLDELIDDAIDIFEELHAMCREKWRSIEEGLTCSYIPSKPYFLNDGFVFIKTPDNVMHVYHFVKPNKYASGDWKKFNMNHMYDEKWTNEIYYAKLEEIISKGSDKIIFKVECKNETVLENNALGVINHMIFSMLNRDYSF